MIALSSGFAAADAFYQSTFDRLHPDLTPNRKVGRPESEEVRVRKLRGDLLTLLLDAAEKKILRTKKAA
jgi:hypothetical protein